MAGPIERSIFARDLDLEDLLQALAAWYRQQKLEVQKVSTDAGSLVLQVRPQKTWRKYVGMGSTLNIDLKYDDPQLKVVIGTGSWVDKAAVGGVAIVAHSILLPLAIPAS